MQKNQIIVCGKATFSINANKAILSETKLKLQLNKIQWSILQGDYQKKNWKQLFQIMDSSDVQELQFDWNYKSKLLKQINHVNFSQLKILSLSFNNIDNLQAFCWINCPKLNQLFLNYNNICRLNCFKKSLLKNIKKLIINQNPIKEAFSICRFDLQQKIFEKFALDIQQQGFSHLVCEDISFVFKIKAVKICNLWKGHKDRIIQQKLAVMVKKKWIQIQILDNQESSSDEEQDEEDLFRQFDNQNQNNFYLEFRNATQNLAPNKSQSQEKL